MLTSCNTKPQRGVTMVASRFNGWYIAARKKRAFRYATSNPCRVPTARYTSTSSLPAIEMAGYHCLMPTASLAKLQNLILFAARIGENRLQNSLRERIITTFLPLFFFLSEKSIIFAAKSSVDEPSAAIS